MENKLILSKMSLADDSDHALRAWYRQYKEMDADAIEADSPLITDVQHDLLDASEIKNSIEKALKTVHVEKGFCTGCSNMFNNWPTIGTKHGAHGIARQTNTSEMEAARRNGCRCCTFILSQTDTNVLDTFRRLERRLAILGSSESSSISVWNWGSVRLAQCLWVNLPGKIATDANSSLAQLWEFESRVAPPDGMLKRY
jgi:hypothetical protein